MQSTLYAGNQAPIRVSSRFESPESRESRRCSDPSCEATTWGSKPFCPDHVRQTPYAQEVLAQLEAAEREVARVVRVGRRAIDPKGLTSQEVLREVRVHGAQSALRMARTLGLDVQILQIYLRELARRGKLQLRYARRGRMVVHPYEATDRSVA